MALSQINQPFDPHSDAEKLRKAMKGLGTDEKAIVQVLGRRPSHQRAEIAKAFKTAYGKDLVKALESEISGNFLKVCRGLCGYLSEFDARCLRKAIEGAGTDEEAVIDILSMRNNEQIRAIKTAYTDLFKRSLEKDVRKDTSGYFERVLVSLLTANRDESTEVQTAAVQHDVESLYQAGENRFGTDESSFNRVLCARSLQHIAEVAAEYQRRHNKSLKDVIVSETSGSYRDLLVSIVSFAVDPIGHAASLFYKSVKGVGTNDRRLRRMTIAFCEADMPAIKAAFQRQFGQSLGHMVRADTSGDYQKILLTLLGEM